LPFPHDDKKDPYKEYALNVKPEAGEMLGDHAAFLARLSRPAADRLINVFSREVNSLKTMPDRYTWLDRPGVPRRKYRKLPFEKHYMILYHIDDDIVHIDAVVDARMDFVRFIG
jgi:plasmid stabilization system protein ParE